MENAVKQAATLCRIEAPQEVPLADLEAELARRMKPGAGAPAVWARMSNLLIYCDSDPSLAQVRAELPTLLHLHPARVLLLAKEAATGTDDLTATVQTWACPGPGGRELGSEQVTLRASAGAAARLPFLVRELMISDLPTNMWWAVPRPPAPASPLLAELSGHIQQLVYDSYAWPDPVKGMAATASWLEKFERPPGSAAWRAAADLNWRRLKFWRRLLAQALDPNSEPGAIDSVREVVVEHGPHALAQAWELVAWMATRLGWQVDSGKMRPGVEIAWRLASSHGPIRITLRRLTQGPGEIRECRVVCGPAPAPLAIRLAVQDDRRLSATREGASGVPRTLTVQPQSVAALVARQLSDREHDPIFRKSMAIAQRFAQALHP